MGADEVRGFLSWLASERNVAAATQAQALAAILFLYKQVLEIELPWIDDVVRARRPKRLPVVLSRVEVRQVLAGLPDPYRLVASLLLAVVCA
jgi:integrase